MDQSSYFNDLFKSVPDYRKVVLITFLIKNDVDLLKDCVFLKSVINRLFKKFRKVLMEKNEQNLDHIKNEEESILENNSNK